MSKHVSTHALERAIAQTTHGALRSLAARQQALGYDQLQEIENQFQVPISGTASSGIGWTTFTLAFDVEFFFAPYQRDSPLAVPHFTYGAVAQGETVDINNPAALIAVFCQVVDWSRDTATNAINGAAIGVGVSTVGGGDVTFSGYVHLTFQGYGAPTEQNPALDVGQ